MAATLGATFLGRAKRPIDEAADHLWKGRVSEALSLLARDRLEAGLRDGVAEAARRAGTREDHVGRNLPGGDIEQVLGQLDLATSIASTSWNQHASQLGGFALGVADVTVQQGISDAASYLMRLAGKVSRDKHLAGPLRELSAAVEQWEKVLVSCEQFIDADPRLRGARTRKLVVRVALAVIVVAGAAGVFGVGGRLWASRRRVDAILASTDPCAVETLAPVDRARATPAQLETAAAHLRKCEDARVAEQKAAEEKRWADAYESRCQTLATHVDAGGVAPEDAAAAETQVALLTRVARKALETADLTVTAMPCARSPKTQERLWASTVRAAAASPSAWAGVDQLSPAILSRLVTGNPVLSADSKVALRARAEQRAKEGLLRKDASTTGPARALCDLEELEGIVPGSWCRGVQWAARNGR